MHTTHRHPLCFALAAVLLLVACTGCHNAGPPTATSATDEGRIAALADSISDCLDDPSTFPQADSLLRQVFATPGIEKQEAFPIFLYHQGIYHFYTGDMAQAKNVFLRLSDMLPLSVQPNLSISVPQTLTSIHKM